MSEKLRRHFLLESRELLEALSEGLLAIEGAGGRGPLDALLVRAHTLKGAAGTAGAREIAELTHTLEDELEKGRRTGALPAESLRAAFRLIDALGAAVARFATPPGATIAQAAPMDVEPDSDGPPAAPSPSGEPPGGATMRFAPPVADTVRVELGELDAVLEAVAEAGVQLADLQQIAAEIEDAGLTASRLLEGAGRRLGREGAAAPLLSIAEQHRAQLARIQRRLQAGLDRVEREIEFARRRVGEVRLVPARTLFGGLGRAVRDAAEALGKRVVFEARGGEHGLEAPVLAALRDALLHIVRNAVAHGIEEPAERERAGKEPVGSISLEVRRKGPRIELRCRDDGRGVDVEKVRRTAVREELLTVEEAAELSAEEALGLIFHAGLSTSDSVDAISGRGVGLGALRQLAARFDAEVHARSLEGRGLTIALTVPVSTASLAVLEVVAGGLDVSIPLDAVRRAVRVGPEDVAESGLRIRETPGGDWIPFLPLATLLGREPVKRRAGERQSAVVMGAGSERFAVGVQRVGGTGHVLVRELPALAGPTPVVLGASFDGRGDPVLVVDPIGAARAVVAESLAHGGPERVRERERVLVIDDSLTSRMLEMAILGSAGYDVDVAASAEEGLERAKRHRYGLFLVDVEMPGMDGFGFVEEVQRDPDLRDVPAIFVSSRATAEDRKRGRDLGARAYVNKNQFDEHELLRTIRGVLGDELEEEESP